MIFELSAPKNIKRHQNKQRNKNCVT